MSFCFVKRTSAIRHLKRAYLSIIDQKISHLHLHASVSQCKTNSDKVSDSKHFFSLSFLFFSLSSHSQFYHSLSVVIHSFVSVHKLLYATIRTLIRIVRNSLYSTTRTLTFVSLSDLHFVRFCINCTLYLSSS